MAHLYSREGVRNVMVREVIAELNALVDELIEDDMHEESSGVLSAMGRLMRTYNVSKESMVYYIDKATTNLLKETK